jgi:hypothetical protein
VACLAIVEAESLVILSLTLLRVDLSSVEVYVIYVHYVNVLLCAAVVAVVILVTFA